jgi:hypothetical protein
MNSSQLRCHIPIAAPARREAARGDESPFRLVLGFEPRWFHVRCGADLGERWHRDPSYRQESLRTMRGELIRSFPETDQWSGAEEYHTNTIAGVHGVGVIPAVFGVPLRYYPDRWPHIEPGHELSDDAIESLDSRRLLAGPFAGEVLEQVEAISAWGPVYGDLNWQGVLNNAFHVRGDRIFLDMAERPELAERLFDAVAEVMTGLARTVQERQRRSGFDRDFMCVSNCTVSMISPAMYARMLLERDARIAESFSRFGVHTCNRDVTPYLGALRRLPKMGYLDMGLASDPAKAREAFPGARLAVLYPPGRLLQAFETQLRTDLVRVRDALAPCDIVLADIPWDAPDSAVRYFIETCRELEAGCAVARAAAGAADGARAVN